MPINNTHFSPETVEEFMAAEISAAKKTIIGGLAALATYALGTASGIYVAAYAGTAVMMLTGVAFIALVVELFVILLALLATAQAAAYVTAWVTGDKPAQLKAKVKGWFSRKDSIVVKDEMAERKIAARKAQRAKSARAKSAVNGSAA